MNELIDIFANKFFSCVHVDQLMGKAEGKRSADTC